MVAKKTRRALAAAGLFILIAHSTSAQEPYHYSFDSDLVLTPVTLPATPRPQVVVDSRPGLLDRTFPSRIEIEVPQAEPGYIETRQTQQPTKPASATSITGTASWYASHCNCNAMTDQRWRGQYVTITGQAGSARVLINDAGPVPSLKRVADLNPTVFKTVCGPLSMGLCKVTITP